MAVRGFNWAYTEIATEVENDLSETYVYVDDDFNGTNKFPVTYYRYSKFMRTNLDGC